ncbi:MAG: hypothetical protein IKQ97_08860 [Eubacterium sp.]|nr:hypothetical protein [Eubacterium sp.]
MTKVNGFGAYQNTMMNALNRKQKAEADKTEKKAEEQEKIRASKRNEKADKSGKTSATQDTEVQLSDKAKALLSELKEKYGNMDFFVADFNSDEEAQKYLSRGTKEFSVLIDPATLEAMAADEETKTKYTDMIDKATAQLSEIKEQLEEDEGTEVKRIGISFDDEGNMSMFAELEQISERRREAIAKEREARKAEKEAAEKAAEDRKEGKTGELAEEERKIGEQSLRERIEEAKENGELEELYVEQQQKKPNGPRAGRNLWDGIERPDEKVKRTIVSANTVEDLIAQIKGVNWDEVEAVDRRPKVGGRFDFSM